MTAQTTAAPGPVSRAEETRQRFVDAAVTLFGEHGYGATSMSQVAAAAGASRANLYLYFHSKPEIVLEWMPTLRPELDQIYLQLDLLQDHSSLSCRDWLDGMVALWRAHPTELDAVEQATSEDSDVHRHRVELCRRTADGFRTVRQAPDGSAHPPETRAARRAHLMVLILSTERCISSIVLHNAVTEEEAFLEALARQWSDFLSS